MASQRKWPGGESLSAWIFPRRSLHLLILLTIIDPDGSCKTPISYHCFLDGSFTVASLYANLSRDLVSLWSLSRLLHPGLAAAFWHPECPGGIPDLFPDPFWVPRKGIKTWALAFKSCPSLGYPWIRSDAHISIANSKLQKIPILKLLQKKWEQKLEI